MEIVEILYIVLTIFTVVVGTLLSVVLYKLIKILDTLEEIIEIYDKVKAILNIYSQLPEIAINYVKNMIFGDKK